MLISAAVLKAFSMKEFSETLEASRLIPVTLVMPFAVVLILAELTIGATLLHKRLWPFGSVAGIGLFLLFGGYSAWRQVASISAPCDCFGPLFRLPPATMLGINMLSVASLITMDRLNHMNSGDPT
jgi:hypothetical protein